MLKEHFDSAIVHVGIDESNRRVLQIPQGYLKLPCHVNVRFNNDDSTSPKGSCRFHYATGSIWISRSAGKLDTVYEAYCRLIDTLESRGIELYSDFFRQTKTEPKYYWGVQIPQGVVVYDPGRGNGNAQIQYRGADRGYHHYGTARTPAELELKVNLLKVKRDLEIAEYHEECKLTYTQAKLLYPKNPIIVDKVA